MNKLIALIVFLSIIAITMQMIGGIINATQNSININIIGWDLRITSEHLWWDSLFLMEFVILLAIIYSTNTLNKQ